MRPKKTHAEPIQPVADGERRGFLYRWNTGEVQVMWLSESDFEASGIPGDREDLQDNNIETKL